jgi:glucose-1-phosphate thymidylyltransferase
LFRELFGDGSKLGLSFSYAEQPRPEGLAQAFIIGKDFIGADSVALSLGDNIFHVQGFSSILRRCAGLQKGGLVFGYPVKDPQRYGVVEFDQKFTVINIEEKPAHPKSRYAVPGLYFYDKDVAAIACGIKPSARGELRVQPLGRGFCWLDTGTHDALQQAAGFVQAIQERQGMKISCIEEIAFRLGYITGEQLAVLASDMLNNQYGQYLMAVLAAEESLTGWL